MAAARPILAQNKPDKLVYIGDNQGGWKRTLMEEVGPAFEKETGIKVEFTLLPPDAWQARLKAEFGAGSSGVDIAQWRWVWRGWISPHMLDHHEVLSRIEARDPAFDWSDFLAGSKLAASYDGKLSGIPYRVTTGILVYQKALLAKAGFAAAPGTFAEFEKAALAVNAPPDRYAVGLMGKQGAGLYSSLASWLYSAGGRLVDFKTGEIFINDDKAVTALQFMADLVVKHKVDAAGGHDLGIRRDYRRRPARPLCDGANLRALHDVDKRPRAVENWRKLVCRRRARPHRQEPEPDLDRRPFSRGAEIREEPRLVDRVHSHGVQQAVAAALDGAWQRAAARLGAKRPQHGGEARLAANGRARHRDRRPYAGSSGMDHAGADAADRHIGNPAGPEDRQAGARRSSR